LEPAFGTATQTPIKASTAAYIATALFLVILVVFAGLNANAIPPTATMPLNYVALSFHLIMLFVIASLSAPLWARMAGFSWAAIDSTVDVMNINGVPFNIAWGVRLGSHIAFAVFLAGAGWQAKGTFRAVGYLTAVLLAGYSLVAPYVPGYGLMPAMVLLIVWLVLAARELAAHEGSRSRSPEPRLAKG
jgi:hypothetical protein